MLLSSEMTFFMLHVLEFDLWPC